MRFAAQSQAGWRWSTIIPTAAPISALLNTCEIPGRPDSSASSSDPKEDSGRVAGGFEPMTCHLDCCGTQPIGYFFCLCHRMASLLGTGIWNKLNSPRSRNLSQNNFALPRSPNPNFPPPSSQKGCPLFYKFSPECENPCKICPFLGYRIFHICCNWKNQLLPMTDMAEDTKKGS